MVNSEIFFRRNLPHWQPPGATFFITCRLAGALPTNVISKLEKEHQRLQNLSKNPKYSKIEWDLINEKKMFAIWDAYLDKQSYIQWLLDPRIAKVVQDDIYYYAGERYSLDIIGNKHEMSPRSRNSKGLQHYNGENR